MEGILASLLNPSKGSMHKTSISSLGPTKKHNRDPSWRPSRILPAHHANLNEGSRSRTAPRHLMVSSFGEARAERGEPDAAERWLDEFKAAGIDAFDFSKCEAAVADKRAEMAPPATDDDVNPSDGGEENGETEEDGHDASQGENESK